MRTFDRQKLDGVEYLELDNAQWRWALREAFQSMGLIPEVDLDYLRLPVSIKMPTIRMYVRVWDPKSKKNNECFESIQAGAVITIPVFILSELEQSSQFNGIQIGSRAPTKEEVIQAFRIIGESIGLSPWGSKFGYGRFNLL